MLFWMPSLCQALCLTVLSTYYLKFSNSLTKLARLSLFCKREDGGSERVKNISKYWGRELNPDLFGSNQPTFPVKPHSPTILLGVFYAPRVGPNVLGFIIGHPVIY